MNTDALTNPTVKAAIEAIQTGDKRFMDLSQRLLSGCALAWRRNKVSSSQWFCI